MKNKRSCPVTSSTHSPLDSKRTGIAYYRVTEVYKKNRQSSVTHRTCKENQYKTHLVLTSVLEKLPGLLSRKNTGLVEVQRIRCEHKLTKVNAPLRLAG